MRQLLLFAGLLGLGPPLASAEAAPAARWTALADCAAAYQANARLADPGRPASMTAQISDVASDYAKAATHAYHQQAGATASQAKRVVDARIATKMATFGGRPRDEVERFIDACPQTDN